MARKRGTRTDKVAKVDKALKSMFRSLQERPTPADIRTIVDQLEDTGGKPTKAKP